MKTILQFDDEELDVARMAFNGAEAHFAIQAIKEQCRLFIKYDELSEEEEKRLEQIREMCYGFDID